MTFDRITVDPAKMGGQPCIRRMRLTVKRVLEALAAYPNPAELLGRHGHDVVHAADVGRDSGPASCNQPIRDPISHRKFEGLRAEALAEILARVAKLAEKDLERGAAVAAIDSARLRATRATAAR